MKPIFSAFDIETSAMPLDQIQQFKPEFKAPANFKDEAKIAANIAEQEQAWGQSLALSALTSRVLCIGLADGLATFDVAHAPDERDVIERFWNWLSLKLGRSERVVGFNIFGFDLPYLIRRSWILNLEIPSIVRRGRYWHDDLVDLMEVWKCGNYQGDRISLDMLAKALGIGAKNGSGKDFAALWASDQKAAIEYLRNDLDLVRKCADRML